MTDENKIIKYLIDSLKQKDGYHRNIINANHKDPCGICQKNVNYNQKAIECTNCNHWIHMKCNGTPDEDYFKIITENSTLKEDEILKKEWLCNKCHISNRAKIFPFGFENNFEL